MPARNLIKWNAVPGKLQDGEYVDSRIYSDEDIFNKELKTIFSKVWIPVCHESELPETFSFRTSNSWFSPLGVGPDIIRGVLASSINTESTSSTIA